MISNGGRLEIWNTNFSLNKQYKNKIKEKLQLFNTTIINFKQKINEKPLLLNSTYNEILEFEKSLKSYLISGNIKLNYYNKCIKIVLKQKKQINENQNIEINKDESNLILDQSTNDSIHYYDLHSTSLLNNSNELKNEFNNNLKIFNSLDYSLKVKENIRKSKLNITLNIIDYNNGIVILIAMWALLAIFLLIKYFIK